MTSSIREALAEKSEKDGKYGDTISSVLLTMRSNVNEGKAVVIVEGPDDVELYGRMYRNNNIIVLPVNSCRHIIEVLKALNPKGYSDRLLAIKDADFDHLNKTVHEYRNLFLTDYHDAEITEIESPETIDAAWNNHIKELNIPLGLKDEIYSELTELSMLKWYNYTNKTKISFKKTKIGSSIDNSYHFDYDKYLKNLFSRDPNIGKQPDENILKKWKSDHDSMVVCTQITNGHDFIELLLHKAKQYTHGNITTKVFAKTIRDNYPITVYKKTNMAQNIEHWMSEKHYL